MQMGKENPGFEKELADTHGYIDEFGVAGSERSWGRRMLGLIRRG